MLVPLMVVAFTPQAEAETRRPCADRDSVVERLENRFGEARQAMGMHGGNGVLEVYASADTGTWTILVTSPDGKSCLLASGDLWETETGPVIRPEKGA
jgi:hypothetical protein